MCVWVLNPSPPSPDEYEAVVIATSPRYLVLTWINLCGHRSSDDGSLILKRLSAFWRCFTCNLKHVCSFTWKWNVSVTLRGERRLMMFENRVLRKIFGPKMDEVAREWRRLHCKELWSVLIKYYLGDQIKDEIDGACSMYGEGDGCI
jgi:hypothetical protein